MKISSGSNSTMTKWSKLRGCNALPQELNWTESEWVNRLVRFLLQYPDQIGEVYKDQERRSWDNTRVDILTERLAIEVDRAYKWAEAVGQAFLYGIQHRRERAIILLSESFVKDARHIHRCEKVCLEAGIHLWLVNVVKSEMYVYGDRFDLIEPDIREAGDSRRKLKGL